MKQINMIILTLLLSGCIVTPTPQPTSTINVPFVIKQEENPFAPKPEDTSKRQTGVILTSLNLSEHPDLTPVRAELNILGSVPSSCHELRVKINPPTAAYEIFIEIYSIVNPNLNCEDVFQQIETSILLGVYSAGRYSIWVNDELVGDIVSY